MTQRYELRLKTLKFISPVDKPAQETATVRLLKREDGALALHSENAKVVKLDDELGLAFLWAVTDQANGEDYFDLQGDHVIADDSMIKVALEYALSGAPTDEQHNRIATGTVPFIMPMTADVAKAFGIQTSTTGIMIGLKPPPDVFAKLKNGTLTGVSIDGIGERTPIDKSKSKGKAKADDDEVSDADRAALDEEERRRKEREAAERERTERDVGKGDDIEAWVASHPHDEQVRLARLNPAATWAAPILKAHEAEVVKRTGQAEADEQVRKAVTDRVTAEQTLDRIAKRYAADLGVSQPIGLRRALDANDREARAALRTFEESRRTEADARARAILKRDGADEDPAALERELDDMVEAFAVAHNLDQLAARKRLLKISRKAQDLSSRWEAARKAIAKARAEAEVEMVAVHQAATQKAADEAHAAAMADIEKRRTPTERALHERIEVIAKARNCTTVQAWRFIREDALASRLLAAYETERAGLAR